MRRTDREAPCTSSRSCASMSVHGRPLSERVRAVALLVPRNLAHRAGPAHALFGGSGAAVILSSIR